MFVRVEDLSFDFFLYASRQGTGVAGSATSDILILVPALEYVFTSTT